MITNTFKRHSCRTPVCGYYDAQKEMYESRMGEHVICECLAAKFVTVGPINRTVSFPKYIDYFKRQLNLRNAKVGVKLQKIVHTCVSLSLCQ